MSQVVQKQSLKLVAYLGIAALIYIIAVALASAFHLLFPNVKYIDVDGNKLDIVSYLILGTFDLIFFVIQTVVVAFLLFIVWFYNFLVVDLFFHGIGNWLNLDFFKAVQKTPESAVTLFANAINSLRLEFVGFIGNFFGDVSEGITDIFGGVL
jgi:hypothetical protein